MAQPNDTEGIVEGEAGEGENELIKDLRAKLAAEKAENKELNEFKTDAVAQAEAARANAVESIVNDLNFPGLKDDVLGWVEGPVTEQAVIEVLQARGLLGEQLPEGQPQTDGAQNEGEQTPVVPTSQLGQEVASAAQGGPIADANQRLATATTVAEVNAVMSELGATRDYSSG
jgi:hypothetical protein